MNSGSGDKYPTMSVEEIGALPIKNIADKNSVLFLWATVPLLPEALNVMSAWGFRYKTKITWHKVGRKGLGYWLRGEVEDLLFGVRGNVKEFRCQSSNFLEIPPLAHSEKPEEFRRLIEAATEGMEPKIELFARKRVPGWVCLGNEIDGRNIVDSLADLRKEVVRDAVGQRASAGFQVR